MATLTADTPRDFPQGDLEHYPVIASDIIYEGAFVGENGSGFARPLVAADPFMGVAVRKADNSSGAAGDINVQVKTKGRIIMPVAGATSETANDRPLCYASDDDTLTLTSTSNTAVGTVQKWISGTTCVVEFDAKQGL